MRISYPYLLHALATATSPPKETRYTLIPKNRFTGLRNDSEAFQGIYAAPYKTLLQYLLKIFYV
jgi:hypothetical protein